MIRRTFLQSLAAMLATVKALTGRYPEQCACIDDGFPAREVACCLPSQWPTRIECPNCGEWITLIDGQTVTCQCGAQATWEPCHPDV